MNQESSKESVIYNSTIWIALLFLGVLHPIAGKTEFQNPDSESFGIGDINAGYVQEVNPASQVRHPREPLPTESSESVSGGSNAVFITVNAPPEGDEASAVKFTTDGVHIVVAHLLTQNLVVFDATTRQAVSTIPLSGSPHGLAITPDNNYAVTANIFEDTVSIVDLQKQVELDSIDVGDQPSVVRITSDGSTAVVGNTLSGSLSVIDIETATQVREIFGANFSELTASYAFATKYQYTEFEITPDDTTVIFPDRFNDQIGFFDITTGLSTFIPSQPRPAFVELSPDGLLGFISHGSPESILSVLDVTTGSITRTIPLGGPAENFVPVVVNAAKTRALVTVSSGVRLVDLTNDSVSNVIYTGRVNGMEGTADGQYAVLANYTRSLVDLNSGVEFDHITNTRTPDFLAVSPADARAATVNFTSNERLDIFSTNGAAGVLEGMVSSGPPEEGDKAVVTAVTPAGNRAVVVNHHSENIAVVDLLNLNIDRYVATGEEPRAVAITSDGNTAVVVNYWSDFVSVIDLETGVAQQVNISWSGIEVVISPDGEYAYVSVLADSGVWRIRLNPLGLAGPKIETGVIGGISPPPFGKMAGMTLSHDGRTLVTCNSSGRSVSVINTETWQEEARVNVGDTVVRAAFSQDDSLIFVSETFHSEMSIISNAGTASSLLGDVNLFGQPFELIAKHDGSRVYVGAYLSEALFVVDPTIPALIDTVYLPGDNAGPVGLAIRPDGRELYVTTGGGDLHVFDTRTDRLLRSFSTGRITASSSYSPGSGCVILTHPLGDNGISILCPDEIFFVDSYESAN